MPRPFVVNVAAIKSTPGSRMEISVESPLAELFVSGSRVPEDASVHFDGVLASIEGPKIVAEGKVATPFSAECGRCLQPISSGIETNVREVFEPKAVDGETYPLDSDKVDLEPMIREAVVLELPEVSLCTPDCAGLCPECGINRNDAVCNCIVVVGDPRWAALEGLKVDDD